MTDDAVRSARRWPGFLGYVFAAGLCVGLLIWILELWNADLTVPFTYEVDSLYYEMLVQSTVENGWYLHNPRLGAPHGLDMRDFPLSDSLHFAIVRLIGLAVAHPVVVFNLFFLLTFPLTTLTALFVLRRLGVAYGPALMAGILYAFLPYHILRNCQLFFAAYYLVPLMVLVVVWLCQDEFVQLCTGDNPRLRWRSARFLGSVVICGLMACGGVYYAFFGCFFLAVAAIVTAVSRRAWAPLWAGAILATVIVLGGVANGIPYLQARLQHGKNAESLRRSPVGAELYGLKVAQLVLPVTNHRVAFLARGKALYNQKMPLVTENDHSSLGVISSVGFLILIALLFARRSSGERPTLLEALSRLNLFAVLLGAIGGFGFFLSLVLPEIRAFNRVSVYIGFFALAALAICLERLQARFFAARWKQAGFVVLLGALIVVGVLDQTPSPLPYAQHRAAFRSDAAFVQAIERELPAEAMVFQLPHVPFPENAPVHRMQDYDHLRGYMHSKTLRWSYPTMRGRWPDAWQEAVAQKPVDELLPTLALAGFSGLYIDRFGYTDHAAALEKQLADRLRQTPLVSGDGRMIFFDLTHYAADLQKRYVAREWQALHQRVMKLQPVTFPSQTATRPAIY